MRHITLQNRHTFSGDSLILERMPWRSRPQHRPPARPHFYWQGALIILPALVLAAVGFSSLRRDHALATHQALEAGGEIAGEVAQAFWREVMPPGADAVQTDNVVPGIPATPEEDPIFRRSYGTAFLESKDGALFYPRPVAAPPAPLPLDTAAHTEEQRGAWNSLNEQWREQATAADENDGLKAFSSTAPPPRFAAIATFRSALARERAGDVHAAAALFQSVVTNFPDAQGETGFPLRDFAESRLLSSRTPAELPGLLNALAGRLVTQPSILSASLLEQLAVYGGTVERWTRVQKAHERARAFAAAYHERETAGDSFIFQGEQWFVFENTGGDARWVTAITRADAIRACEGVVQSLKIPRHFAVSASLGETTLLQAPADKRELGFAHHPYTGNVAAAPVNVHVFLADPDSFYAEQRIRSLRFGALIALSAGAVLVGFFAAWRAFHNQQQLSEMKTNFVSSVSHELRAPIASVRLMAEELAHRAEPSPQKLRQYHGFIVQECRRLSDLIENVLDFSRREQGRERFEFEPTDLVRLVETTVKWMRAYGSEKEVRLETVHLGEAEPIEADGRALQRLLVNLIDNAIKHSPNGEKVTVGLEFERRRVFLWVEDRGPGIPHSEHERIFERFYRIGSELRRETQGVGLGLSIVKHLAEVHGGRVLVRSDVGKGSRFTVELPLEPKPSDSTRLPETESSLCQ